jgi:hypothetical protein
MPAIGTVTRFRRLAAGLSLVGFGAAQLASSLVWPDDGDTAADNLQAAATYPGRLLAGALLLLVAAALLIPAIGGIVHLVCGRGAVLGHLGAAFGILGALGLATLVAFALLMLALPGGDQGEMVALLERINHGPALAVGLPLLLSLGLGMLLLSLALRRARLIPRWVLAAVVAAVLINLLAPEGMLPAHLAKEALAATAMLRVGLMMLRLPDRAWAAPERAAQAIGPAAPVPDGKEVAPA